MTKESDVKKEKSQRKRKRSSSSEEEDSSSSSDSSPSPKRTKRVSRARLRRERQRRRPRLSTPEREARARNIARVEAAEEEARLQQESLKLAKARGRKKHKPPAPNQMVAEQLTDSHKRSGAGIMNLLSRLKADELEAGDFQEEDWMHKPKEKYYLEVSHKTAGVVNRIEIYNKKWIVVGRQYDNDICVLHNTVSRRHCIIGFRKESGCYLYDLGSTHGTYVNDGLPMVHEGKIESGRFVRLHSGSKILFGRCAYQYKLMHEGEGGNQDIARAKELVRAQQLSRMRYGLA